MTALDHRPVTRGHGPYDSFADADRDVDAIIFLGKPGDGVLPKLAVEQAMREILAGALAAARVTPGHYDQYVVDEIGQFEPHFIVAVAGLIERAFASGQDSILGGVQSMLDHPAETLQRDVSLIRCAATGCPNVELLQVGSTLLCPDHGGEHHDIKTGA